MLARGMARVATASLLGLRAKRIRVEVDIAADLPGFTLTGLPSAALREARERIGAALRRSGHRWPDGRITVHLAPAELRKDGAAMDLAIAAAMLYASGQLERPGEEQLRRTLFLGELALDGAVRPVRGALALGLAARELGISQVVLPASQAPLLRGCTDLRVAGLRHLCQLAAAFGRLRRDEALRPPTVRERDFAALSRLAGQERALRAVCLAAAGRHSLLLIGPPGCGKTLLARALWELLPDLPAERWLERLRIASLREEHPDPLLCRRPPLRAPHHSVSAAALIGGQHPPQPGEVTRAHAGLLFLDELGEFPRERLDLLREPLENRRIVLSRGGGSVEFPCDFQLVAASNPCPCGHHGSRERPCRCAPSQLRRYRSRLSGPLRDRIDLCVEMDRPRLSEGSLEPSRCELLRTRVAEAARRLEGVEALRVDVGVDWIRRGLHIGERLALSGRAVVRSLELARTIAVYEGAGAPDEAHFLEAVSYRQIAAATAE